MLQVKKQVRRSAAVGRTSWRRASPGDILLIGLCAVVLGFGQLAAADDPSSDPPDARQDGEEGAPSAPNGDEGSAAPDPEVIEPGPDGCPFNNQRLDLIV